MNYEEDGEWIFRNPIGRLFNRFLFHLCHPAANTNYYSGLGVQKKPLSASLFNKIPKHLLGGFKIRNYASYQRPSGYDITRGPANHLLCLLANSQDLSRLFINCHYLRFNNNYSSIFDIDSGIGGTQINRNVLRNI